MPPPLAASHIPIGTVLAGKYKVTREIGRGGMAAVYEARHVEIGKRVAVKVLNAELTHSTVVVERFLREARAAAAVDSPYICDVYDAGKLHDGRPFLVLELLEGESLYDQMVKVRRFEPPFIAQVFAQIGKGLTKAHDAKIIHRDLKPENIFLTKTDDGETVAKILDFGLAKFYAPVAGTSAQQRLTREGAIFGTPAYMSPEQVKGQGQVDHRADLWALGCIAFECLTGRTVWTTDHGVAMIFAQVATAPLPMPSKLRAELPPAFDEWFRRALARDPEKRFQSAKEMIDELVAALCGPVSRPSSDLSGSQPESAPGPALEQPLAFAPTQPPPAPAAAPPPSAALPPGTPPAASVVATSTTIDKRAPPSVDPKKVQARRTVWAVGGAIVVALAGLVVWRVLIRPQPRTIPMIAVSSSASSSASASASARLDVAPTVTELVPKWAVVMASAQELFSKGEYDGAMKGFKEAVDSQGGHVARALWDHAQAAASNRRAPCRSVGIGRPRGFELTSFTHRPTIAVSPRGPLVVWNDDHEAAGQWHAYSAVLDQAMRVTSPPIDVTPEAAGAQDLRLYASDERVILLYADAQPRAPGVYIRQLDSTGRITTPPIRITESRASAQSPSLARGSIGDFWLTFVDERDKDSADIFLQKLSPSLRPAQATVRATDFAGKGVLKTRARSPSIAVAGNSVYVVFRLEEGLNHSIARQKIALNDPALVTGLPESKDKIETKDKVLGEIKPIVDKQFKALGAVISCDASGCFVAWREEPKGSNVGFLDPASGTFIWRKRFAANGLQVNVALDGNGRGLLVWFDGGRVKASPITRDGMGEPAIVGRVAGDQPRPEVAAGAAGEWVIAWNDNEAGHIETFVGRVSCR